jgi:fatty-acyl-CoA synthase
MPISRLPFSGAHWVDHVARHAFSIPGDIAIRFEGASITWADLQDRVLRLAAAFAEYGVGEGDRVAILTTNRPEFVETVLAANALRAIAVPLNFRLAPAEVAYVLGDSGCTVIVTDGPLEPLARAAIAQEDDPPAVIVAGPDYEALIAAHEPTTPSPAIEERDVALIMYTSGTTGRPKGAMLTHLNMLMQAITAIRTTAGPGADAVALCNVPLFHIAGIGGMVPSLLLGTRTVIMPTTPFDAEATLDVIEGEGVTGVFLVPAQWQVMCAHPDATSRTQSLRTITWGAAPASVSLLEEMARVFPHANILSAFGQTEMSPVTTVLEGDDAIRKMGSVGLRVPLIAARVVDDEMNDVAPGEIGEIVYRGPTLMAGYWNNAEGTAAALEGGWFHSGDLVRQDDDGFFYVVDRKKDMIISGGENIYCAEVENVLAGHPQIADVAIIGARHERWGETPVAVVVAADPGQPPTLESVTEFTRDRLASYKKPTSLVVVDELPRNAAGKVLKHELRDRYGAAPV